MHEIPVFAFLVPIVGIICTFTFVSIVSWTQARRKEREAYYKSETIKKIAETQGGGGPAALELLREEDRIATRHAREQQRLGGLTSIAAGIGLMLFLGAIIPRESLGVALVGAIPALVGVALLVYSYLLAPKDADSRNAPADR
jgi:Domain of unknown function (DUF6249)